MHRYGVDRVVDAEGEQQVGGSQVDCTTDGTDRDSSPGLDDGTTGGYSDEASEGTVLGCGEVVGSFADGGGKVPDCEC